MLVILPTAGEFEAVQTALTAEQLATWQAALTEQRVDVFLPRFTFESKQNLNQVLSELGMPTAFGSGADFSGMTGSASLMIDKVIHQAFIEVNEEGSEAAAATAVTSEEVAVPVAKAFRADRPFIFAVQEQETGSILFMGSVYNPLQ